MRRLINIITFIFLFSGVCDAAELKSINTTSTQVELTYFSVLADGGTAGFIIKNKEGKTIKFCFDERLSSNTKGELYIGNDHPSNARLVEKGSEESEALMALLQEALENNTNEEVNTLILQRIKKYINS